MSFVRTPFVVLLLLVPAYAHAHSDTWTETKPLANPSLVKPAAAPIASPSPPPAASPPVAMSPGIEASQVISTPSSRDDGVPVQALLGFSSNDLELGFGVRAGKTLPSRIYLGGAFVYHLGHDLASAQAGGYTASASFSAFYVGPEVGYEFDVAPVRVRAYAGLGIMWFNTSTTTSGPGVPSASSHASTNKFVLWPGATVLYPLPNSSFFIGADLRFVTVPDGPAVGLFALAGTRF